MDQPAKGTLDVPSPGLQLKASTVAFGPWNDLPIDENGFPFPWLGRLARWFGGDRCLPTRVRLDPIEQGSLAITDRGCQHEGREQKPLGLHQQHPFAAPDVFSRRPAPRSLPRTGPVLIA